MGFNTPDTKSVTEPCQYAKKLVGSWLPDDYPMVVDESMLGISFKPDIFQKQSFYFLQKHESVFVSAHTSSGKTLVAEYAICLAQKRGSRVIYTSPIKALSNQKFFDFKSRFESVGLITGDVQVNPEANCLIMTTEILRNMVYKNSDLLRSTEFVIFDEVHYINDCDRGVVWEEAIIMLPRHICLVMLSATIPNSVEFSEWVGRTRERCIYVISTEKRAVPLEFVVYSDFEAYSIAEAKSKAVPTNFKSDLLPYSRKTKAGGRFRINDLGHFVTNRRLTPALFFSFSKRSCEEYGRSLENLDLSSPMEKKKIDRFLADAMRNLTEADRYLPQVCRMSEQVRKGIAVHHGSLLPFVKECIEILFSQNLIKILVATETFAMGVNMPAKCCVFLSLTKIDNGSYRYLETGEFIQMSGRAGRRGMDKVGTVIVADQRNPPLATIRKVIEGYPLNLSSQFKLSFSLILMALRGNITVEDLMRSSFKEHGIQKGFARDMARLSSLEALPRLQCLGCEDGAGFLRCFQEICSGNHSLIRLCLKEGDTIVTKDNSLLTVKAIVGNKIECVPSATGLKGVFFSTTHGMLSLDQLIDRRFDESEAATIRRNIGKFSKYCPRVVSEHTKPEVAFEDIMFYVEDGEISFNYNVRSADAVLKSRALKQSFDEMNKSSCIGSDCFFEHYYDRIVEYATGNEISFIKNRYSEQSLVQMGEYTARTKFLAEKGFVADGSVTIKGRVAAEIRTVNDVFVTELVFGNFFERLTSPEILALMSSMIHEEEDPDGQELDKEFISRFDDIRRMYAVLQSDIDRLSIPPIQPLNFGMAQAVYDWATGTSLGLIVAHHLVQEGSFVRLILRLDECCREMINVAVLIGNAGLETQFREGSSMIKRDIVFMPSLYL